MSRGLGDVYKRQLTARVKNSFDPERILNRGRMRKDL